MQKSVKKLNRNRMRKEFFRTKLRIEVFSYIIILALILYVLVPSGTESTELTNERKFALMSEFVVPQSFRVRVCFTTDIAHKRLLRIMTSFMTSHSRCRMSSEMKTCTCFC